MPQYRIYQTIYDDFNERVQASNYLVNYDNALKLIDVTISLFGKIELKEFDNIEEGLLYNLNKVVNYKFIELKNDNGVGFFYVAENSTFDRKVFLTWRMMRIGLHLNLYLNSWDNIYAQGIGDVGNSRFDFRYHHQKYVYLSILIYTLTHIENEDLEEEFEENKKII
jgi:hypothetical protein